MGVDVLRGRFVVRDGSQYHPVEIISSSNSLEYGSGNSMRQARDFFSVTKHCSITGGRKFVDKETAIKCINEHFDELKDYEGKISDSYRGFPKTNGGFVKGFFSKQISKKAFENYGKRNAYSFERYKLKNLIELI